MDALVLQEIWNIPRRVTAMMMRGLPWHQEDEAP